MPTLPWTVAEPSDSGIDALVMGSRLELRSYGTVPAFMGAAMKLRKKVHGMPGAFGVSLIAQLSRKTFWTLSAWSDQAALDAFVQTPEHVAVMEQFHDRLLGTGFTFWNVKTELLPKPRSKAKELWAEAKRRLVATDTGDEQ